MARAPCREYPCGSAAVRRPGSAGPTRGLVATGVVGARIPRDIARRAILASTKAPGGANRPGNPDSHSRLGGHGVCGSAAVRRPGSAGPTRGLVATGVVGARITRDIARRAILASTRAPGGANRPGNPDSHNRLGGHGFVGAQRSGVPVLPVRHEAWWPLGLWERGFRAISPEGRSWQAPRRLAAPIVRNPDSHSSKLELSQVVASH